LISIILPVKEEPYLPTLLTKIEQYVSEPHEVLVQTEKGLGYAVKCGIERSKGDVIAIFDSDGSHNPKYITAMHELLQHSNYDIVIGSRYIKDGKTQDTFIRKVISRIYCVFAQELFMLYIKDNMSGFIVAKKEVFLKYPITNKGYKFGLELLGQSYGVFKAIEYPIVFEQRKLGKSKANYKEAFNTLWFMIKLKAKLKWQSLLT
jgi:dolichol-phosphate mannosyltransferase